MKRGLSLCLWILLLLASLTLYYQIPKANGDVSGSFTVYPVYDTEVNANAPTSQIWYSSTYLQIGISIANSSAITLGWFKFNMSQDAIGLGAINITSANLYLYADTKDWGSGIGIYYLRSIDPTNESAWTDTTITYNNQPSCYSWTEAYQMAIYGLGQYYSFEISPEGNSTMGLQALQNAYDNNRTKSYRVQATSLWSVEFNSLENSPHVPYLEVFYNKTETIPGEDIPYIENPEEHTLKYYPVGDAVVESDYPSGNYGSENIGQISFSATSGTTRDALYKFDLRFPSLVDGNVNTNFYLSNYSWSLTYVTFSAYVDYCPPYIEGSSTDWRPYMVITGISPEGENWTELGVTWNNKPSYREDIKQFYVSHSGYYGVDISLDYSYLHYTVTNGTYYSVANRVDKFRDAYGWSNWRFREYPDIGYYAPNIEIQVQIGALAPSISETLNFYNAHIFLATSLHVTPFIAGSLLCAMIYMAILVPIAYLTKSNDYAEWILTIGSMALFCSFLAFGWLHIGIFAILFLVTLLIQGAELKHELF